MDQIYLCITPWIRLSFTDFSRFAAQNEGYRERYNVFVALWYCKWTDRQSVHLISICAIDSNTKPLNSPGSKPPLRFGRILLEREKSLPLVAVEVVGN